MRRLILTAALLLTPLWAQAGPLAGHYDRLGDRIEARYAGAALRQACLGHRYRAVRLAAHGAGIDRRLDRAAARSYRANAHVRIVLGIH